MPARVTVTRSAAVVTGVLLAYSLARASVQFLEALSIVRAQRAEDEELLDICRRGEARGSAKLRQACLNAHADLASPIVFKAVIHAVGTAFAEFCEAVGSPTKLAILLLFVLSGFAMPLISWMRLLCGPNEVAPAPLQGVHYISYVDGDGVPGSPRAPSLRSRWKGAMNRLRAFPPQRKLDFADDIELRDVSLVGDEECADDDNEQQNAAWLNRVFSRPHAKFD